MELTPQAAAQELLRRQAARNDLIAFAKQVDIPGKPINGAEDQFGVIESPVAAHHELLLRTLQRISETPGGRAMVFMPPGSAKSTYTSVVFPAWLMGKRPGYQIILTSYAMDLARKFGRKTRQLVSTKRYRELFHTGLSKSSSAAEEWALENGSEYMASGLLGGVTGNRANGLIIDDPTAGRDEAESETYRNKTLEAYQDDARSRIKPGGWRAIVACMPGDTGVLMADGREVAMRDLRAGDKVASYDKGELVAARVLNWINHGPDRVFAIKTTSGISVRANARHPFLVDRDGKAEWVRLRNLRIGDQLVGVNGAERCAPPQSVTNQRNALAFARRITTSTNGRRDIDRHPSILTLAERRICGIVMALVGRSISLLSMLREVVALFAEHSPKAIPALIGAAECSVSITTTQPGIFEGCSATTATSWSGAAGQQKISSRALNICGITEIVDDGIEDVFDIQVERTENFLADGFVCHNTRWHEDDLPGSILPEQWGGESGRIRCRDGHDWDIICLPAEADRLDDPLGRAVGEGLWPEWFKPGHWDEFKFPPRSWLSLYQQKPTAEAGTYFKREWFAPHRYTDLPENLSIYMSGDFAVTEGDGDFTEIAVWGIDHADNIYALDWYSGQVTADAWTQAILDRVDRWKPEWFVGETGPIRRAVEPFLMKAMTDRKAYVMVEWLPHGTANKEANARSFQALASVGKVHFPHTEWAERVIDQLLRFPGGKYDDCVDTCSLFGRMLEQTWGAPKKAKKAQIDWSAPPELRIADFEPRGSSYA